MQDQGAGRAVALAHGPVRGAAIELEGLDELAMLAPLVEIIIGRILVETKELDLFGDGRVEQGGIIGIGRQGLDPLLLELVDTGIVRLNANPEAAQIGDFGDPGDRAMREDGHRQLGMDAGKVIEQLALGGAIDHVDDIRLAAQQTCLGLAPLDGGQLDRHAGLFGPELPEIDQIATGLARGILEQIGRKVLVRDHAQLARRGLDRDREEDQ